MGAMKDDTDPMTDEDFEPALKARYQRLSLLTLDLAEEAGEAAVNFSLVDNPPHRAGCFERRISAMTRAIWAHQQIERLRRGGGGAQMRPLAGEVANSGPRSPTGATTPAINTHPYDNTPHAHISEYHPPCDDSANLANQVNQNVSRETQGANEFNRMRTIAGGKTNEEISTQPKAEGENCSKTLVELVSDENSDGEQTSDWPGNADLFGEDSAFADEHFDDAALDDALRQALRDGKRGEDALKAALCVETAPMKSGVRAPP